MHRDCVGGGTKRKVPGSYPKTLKPAVNISHCIIHISTDVIPAKAGIQGKIAQFLGLFLDPCFRGLPKMGRSPETQKSLQCIRRILVVIPAQAGIQ